VSFLAGAVFLTVAIAIFAIPAWVIHVVWNAISTGVTIPTVVFTAAEILPLLLIAAVAWALGRMLLFGPTLRRF
jgi:hypothetical protein